MSRSSWSKQRSLFFPTEFPREVYRKPPGTDELQHILADALAGHGLSARQVASLAAIDDDAMWETIGAAARQLKERIFGNRMVLFAPLYWSNHCVNDCAYCAFRTANHTLPRTFLTPEAVAAETGALLRAGHKRVLLVSGEALPRGGFDALLEAIDTIYATREGTASIRRINVNLAPQSRARYRALKDRGIGTFQLFQETYDSNVYARVHLGGPKADYERRLQAPGEAMAAGLNDLGMGVLLGLADWRREVVALVEHAHFLDREYGSPPHTVSVPRLEPALGSPLSRHPLSPVDDATLLRIIAVLRLALPATGIILSTRESALLRTRALALGVSQFSAGSSTTPGGYSGTTDAPQFDLADHRSLDDVVAQLAGDGYLPSFCTACYRLGRTGADFMAVARPGNIKRHCRVNGLTTFLEYLLDHASQTTVASGERLLEQELAAMPETDAARARTALTRVRQGERDVQW